MCALLKYATKQANKYYPQNIAFLIRKAFRKGEKSELFSRTIGLAKNFLP